MNTRTNMVVTGLVTVTLGAMLVGCAGMMGDSGGGARTAVIPPPDESFQSPNNDATAIKAVGIFPFLPVGAVNEQLADKLTTAFAGEVEARQGSAWKIYSHRDLFSFINEAGLGRGYKHLQADLNSSGAGQVVFTAETKLFLQALKTKFGVDAFLIGSYKYGVATQQRIGFLGTPMVDSQGQPLMENVAVCSTRSTLYSANSEKFWWYGVIARKGNIDRVVDILAKSLAQHIGQGSVGNM